MKRIWVCWWEYFDGTGTGVKTKILCECREKVDAVIYARWMGGQLQCGLGSQTNSWGKRQGGWTSRCGYDSQEPPRYRLKKAVLERRVKYGGKKGRAAARRLKRGWNSRK